MNLSAAVDLGTLIVFDKDLHATFTAYICSSSDTDNSLLAEILGLQLFQAGICGGIDTAIATGMGL